jgi:hypothetical protein
MRHWLVFPGPEISQAAEIVTDAEDAAALAGAGHRVEGPFVPEPPQGAVSDLDAAVRLLNARGPRSSTGETTRRITENGGIVVCCWEPTSRRSPAECDAPTQSVTCCRSRTTSD